LWHGAAFTFIFWGAYHGVFLIIERLGFLNLRFMKPMAIRQMYTWVVIIIGWVIFRASDMNHAVTHIKSMFRLNSKQTTLDFQSDYNAYTLFFLILAFLISTGIGNHILEFLIPQKTLAKAKSSLANSNALIVILYLTCLVALVSNNTNPFIYFRF
jgi:alginate O-acetyltransferase complex protein AlgI